MKAWIDGRVVDADAACVSALDHGLHRGRRRLRDDEGRATGTAVRADPAPASGCPLGRAGSGCPPPTTTGRDGASTPCCDANDVEPRGRACASRSPAAVSPLGTDRGDCGADAGRGLLSGQAAGRRRRLATVPWPRNERVRGAGSRRRRTPRTSSRSPTRRPAARPRRCLLNTAGLRLRGHRSNVFAVSTGQIVTPPLSVRLPGRGDARPGPRVVRGRGARPHRRGPGRAVRGVRDVVDARRPPRRPPGRGRRTSPPGPVTSSSPPSSPAAPPQDTDP